MIGYITIGANDSDISGKFYDAVLGALGNERKFADGGWIGYGPKGKDEHNVYVISPPHDKQSATGGNGMMIAFKGSAKADVDAAYQSGLKSGGKDEGAPGPRPEDSTTFYGAYLRDPVGNKICVYCKP
ncbi:MAG TPA: VOC family protein [Rhizomicrobium sp.]|jgi:catechol 2,3-dioxygenase-like lactoylglutathione lyase family enzyme|nr:VOC family protein [Rhizomicrobium sp.]